METVQENGCALQYVEILSPAVLEAATVFCEEYLAALLQAGVLAG